MSSMVVDGGGKPVTRICEHGQWTFAGAGYSRQATKWRCPTGGCKPASRWIKADRAHPLIPRETPRFTALYRRRAASSASSAASRTNGRSHLSASVARIGSGCTPDLTILAKLACGVARARAVLLAA